MGITKLAIKVAAPIPKIESFDRFLFVGPHPDDIEMASGATVSKLVSEGKTVKFLICIDGRYGTSNRSDLTPEDLITIRKEESIKSAAALGVTDVDFLGLCDGGFYEFSDLLNGIAKTVGEFKPDVIFCPDPDVTSECHIDHLNVGRASKQIACFAPYKYIMERHGAESAPVKAVAFYYTAKPNAFVKTAGHLQKQLDALFKSHVSQFPDGCSDISTFSLYLKLRSIDFGLRCFSGSAEGFRVLSQTHMHCLPEAGD